MAAATLDHAANTLRIETADSSFFDQTASYLIVVDQTQTINALPLKVTVKFKQGLPEFDREGL